MFSFMKSLPTAVRQLAERYARFKGTVLRFAAGGVQLREAWRHRIGSRSYSMVTDATWWGCRTCAPAAQGPTARPSHAA